MVSKSSVEIRTCVSCGKPFRSQSKANRFCKRCSSRDIGGRRGPYRKSVEKSVAELNSLVNSWYSANDADTARRRRMDDIMARRARSNASKLPMDFSFPDDAFREILARLECEFMPRVKAAEVGKQVLPVRIRETQARVTTALRSLYGASRGTPDFLAAIAAITRLGIPEQVVVDLLIGCDILDTQFVKQLSWRIAGNLHELKAGVVVTQNLPEASWWVPCDVLDTQRDTENRVMSVTVQAIAGGLAGKVLTVDLPVSRYLAAARDAAGSWMDDRSPIYFSGCAACARVMMKSGKLTIMGLSATDAQAKENKAMLEARLSSRSRCGVACADCPKGRVPKIPIDAALGRVCHCALNLFPATPSESEEPADNQESTNVVE